MVKNSKEYFDYISEMYRLRGDDLYHYSLIKDVDRWPFSPIERIAFDALKIEGLKFHVEYPAMGYFLDFAICGHKIGIELDGKKWHDPERDAIRDARLAGDGWVIIRVPGVYCYQTIDRTRAEYPEYAGIHQLLGSLRAVIDARDDSLCHVSRSPDYACDEYEESEKCVDVVERFVSPVCLGNYRTFVDSMIYRQEVMGLMKEMAKRSNKKGARHISDAMSDWMAEIHRQRAL